MPAQLRVIHNYAHAKDVLEAARKNVKLGHNTELRYAVARDDIVITYHDNVIVRYCATGEVEYTNSGWRSPTTRARLNKYLPAQYGVYKKNYVEYVRNSITDESREFNGQFWYFNDPSMDF